MKTSTFEASMIARFTVLTTALQLISQLLVCHAQSPATETNLLVWDADSKRLDVAAGELAAHFTFYVTNVSSQAVLITDVERSCGCTEALLPATPWLLAPGTNGPIHATIDLRGKAGEIAKKLVVRSSAGSKELILNVKVPLVTISSDPALDRSRNQQIARQDRQAVFAGKCATCHLEPALAKSGHELYQTACAICHESKDRAAFVPDLGGRIGLFNADYWGGWISASKLGSMMPAFAKEQGGPLSNEQIGSLVEYLTDATRNGL